MDKNQKVFGSHRTVASYVSIDTLQKPQEAILSILKPRLATMNMIDIGTGRTTLHFGPFVAGYTGVDYAPAMVEYSKRRFAGAVWKPRFLHADVRRLSLFTDGQFDFALFLRTLFTASISSSLW